jgi:carbamoylphosphate synthase large subunit
MRNYWVVDELTDYGNIIADNELQADQILFMGILKSEYPLDAILIEEMMEDWQIQVIEVLGDEDIISIE